MDPEDVDAELTRYHTSVRGELERHGGTVEKFIGDAAMAVFGAPVAHEDDPERAVRAALAVRDWAREEGLEVRIGINTGEALVRLDAQPGAGEGMAAGDVVNTASRLQAAAPIDGILVGEATFRATRQSIAYGEPRCGRGEGKDAARPGVGGGRDAVSRRRRAVARSVARRPRRRARAPLRLVRPCTPGALGAARHARRRPGYRQEPSRLRAVPDPRGGQRADPLAARPLSAVRRGRDVLGARRDRQGPGRDPRERFARRGRAQAA